MTVFLNFLLGFLDLALAPLHFYEWMQLATLPERMNAFLLYGKSASFFFTVLALMLILLGCGLYRQAFLRGMVAVLEGFNSKIGKLTAWLAFILMMQQVLILVTGQIFHGNALTLAPFGFNLTTQDLGWLSGQLTFYNALIIALASGYTFIEGGHVRVNLIYGAVRPRVQKYLDIIGTLIFLFPSTLLLWWFSWPVAANSAFDQDSMTIWSDDAIWRGFKWEGSGTSEFSWVWSFKALILVFAALMFLVAFTFLLRNILDLLDMRDAETPDAKMESA